MAQNTSWIIDITALVHKRVLCSLALLMSTISRVRVYLLGDGHPLTIKKTEELSVYDAQAL